MSEDSLEELKARRNEAQSAVVDVDESESAESFELPRRRFVRRGTLSAGGPETGGQEFTCSSCFLVHHRSRLASEERRDDLHGLRRLTDGPCTGRSAAQCGQDAVRAGNSPASTESDRPGPEDQENQRPDPGPVKHKGRRIQLPTQRRGLRGAWDLG